MQNVASYKTKIASIVVVLALLLVSFGISVNGGIHPRPTIRPEIPKAVTGFVYWPNGTLDTTIPISITIKNNQTGITKTTIVDVVPGGLPDGNYQVNLYVNLGNTVYVNCTYLNMWAHSQTIYSGQAFLSIDLHLVALPFGPKLINSASGGNITGFNGAVTLTVPAGALTTDKVIFGTETTAARFGSFDSISLGPKGLVFSSPATLRWSYEGINLGSMPPEKLAIYTSNNGPWERLPSVVDTQTKEVIAQVSHFSNFSMGGAAAFGNQTGLLYAYQGTLDNPILDLTILNTNLTTADTLNYIAVESNSTDNADIAGVSLWNDVNNDQSIGVTDVQIGGTLPFGAANFTGLGLLMPANSSMNLLVALDVAPAAAIDHILDLRVPALGIGMANAGLSEAAIDPVGNATITGELTDPHVVYGFVRNVLGPLPNVWVNLTNNRTLATENLTTDSLGRYDTNLGFMADGYIDGDEIFVTANDTLAQTGWNVTFVDVNNFGERCDIFVGKGPIASDESPANGAIIFDVQRNITINITSNPIPLNLTTVILGVEGVNYTLAGGNLTFAGNTLTFNTFKAIGNWTDGQVVNVTLWQANDTAGNPCQNAPYTWWFLVSLGVVENAPDIRVHKAGANVNITWAAVTNATHYNIYRSLAVNGTGFNWFTTLGSSVNTYFVDAGALSTASNYSYVVRGDCPGGEGPKSNIGWKIIYGLIFNPAVAGGQLNYISLPYNTDLMNAQGLKIDIGISCSRVARWNNLLGKWDSYTGIGINFMIKAGEGYLVAVNANTSYTMVGSYNSSVSLSLIYNPAVAGGQLNYISPSYNVNLLKALNLKNNIGPSCTRVARWNNILGKWDSYTGIGVNFNLKPGEAYLCAMNANNTWAPPIISP
jgi:hypothetical protein